MGTGGTSDQLPLLLADSVTSGRVVSISNW